MVSSRGLEVVRESAIHISLKSWFDPPCRLMTLIEMLSVMTNESNDFHATVRYDAMRLKSKTSVNQHF